MKKMLSALLFASLFIFVGFSAHAKPSSDDCSCGDDFSCDSSSSHERFEGGTFIATRPGIPSEDLPGILDQYILEPDGTAYWNQSNAIAQIITQGTFIPEVGTWEVKGKHVILTTIGAQANPVIISGINDVNLANYTRTTQKFKIINENTLGVRHRVQRAINVDEDPLKANGTVILNSKARFQLKRVKVNPSDLKVK